MPSITSPSIIQTRDNGALVSGITQAYNFIGASVTVVGSQVNVDVTGGGGGFMFTNFSNASASTVNLNLGGNLITNLATPVNASDAATKNYVDTSISGAFMQTNFSNAIASTVNLNLGGNLITNTADPVNPQDVATKNYVDTSGSGWQLGGNTLGATGSVGSLNNFDVNLIRNNINQISLVAGQVRFFTNALTFISGINSLQFGSFTGASVGPDVSTGFSSFAFGRTETSFSNVIQTTGFGSLAFGYAIGSGVAQIIANNGSLAHGFGNEGSVSATGIACHSFGLALSGGLIESSNCDGSLTFGRVETNGQITAVNSYGSLAFGHVTIDSAININTSNGSMVYGYATGNNQMGITNAHGCEVSGYTSGSGALTTLSIGSNAHASYVKGYSGLDGLLSVAPNAFASRVTGYANPGSITSNNIAGFVHGYVDSLGELSTFGLGAVVFGFASSSNHIRANGNASFAGGSSVFGDTESNELGSFSYGDAIINNSQHGAAFGRGLNITSLGCLAGGTFSGPVGASGNSFVTTDPVLLIGNGTSSGSPSVAFRIDKDAAMTSAGSHIEAIRLVSGADAISGRTDRTIIYDTNTAGGNLTMPSAVDGLKLTFASSNGGVGTYTLVGGTFDVSVTTLMGTNFRQTLQALGGVWYRVG